ncbi:MAG: hypothetical protein ACJ74M_04535 [Gaiellaceae bacterium]
MRTPGESSALAIPLALWAVMVLAVVGLAWAFGYAPFHGATWSRYDSIHYEQIARNGYDLVRCPPGVWKPGAWCGDAGWFPGYPWLVAPLHAAGLPLRGSAIAVSWAFAAATLVLLWNTFFRRRRNNVLALVYAAWAPGMIYGVSIFPLSVLAFFTVAWLWLLGRDRFLAAGLAGAAAVLAYPLGVLLIPLSAAWILARRRAWITAALSAGGLAVLFADQAIETGHWNAYSLVQRNYGHHLINPVATTRDLLKPIVTSSELTHVGPALQSLLVTCVLIAVLVVAVRRRRLLERWELLVLLWAVVTWIVPLGQSYLSVQRSQAALVPVVVLFRRLPRPLVVVFAVAAIAVAVLVEKLFLEGKIV